MITPETIQFYKDKCVCEQSGESNCDELYKVTKVRTKLRKQRY